MSFPGAGTLRALYGVMGYEGKWRCMGNVGIREGHRVPTGLRAG